MSDRIKEVAQYRDGTWHSAVPIGADANNIDVDVSDGTQSLQHVLGYLNADMSIQEQLNNKIDTNHGDVKNSLITAGIESYDYDAEETSDKLIPENEEDYEGNQVVVTNSDEDTLSSMWSKFNRFRKRVDNKFKTYLATEVLPETGTDTKGYSTQALNNYFNDVIGYTSAASVQGVGKVADQLSSLNSNAIKNISRTNATFTATRMDGSTFTFTQKTDLSLHMPTQTQSVLVDDCDAGYAQSQVVQFPVYGAQYVPISVAACYITGTGTGRFVLRGYDLNDIGVGLGGKVTVWYRNQGAAWKKTSGRVITVQLLYLRLVTS